MGAKSDQIIGRKTQALRPIAVVLTVLWLVGACMLFSRLDPRGWHWVLQNGDVGDGLVFLVFLAVMLLPAVLVVGGLEEVARRSHRHYALAVTTYSLFAGFLLFAGVYSVVAPAGSNRAAPNEGTFVGAASSPAGPFEITFRVSRSAITNSVITWDALCQSGKGWHDQSLSNYAPISGWSGGQDYVVHNSNGITEHVHIIRNTGQFATPTRATGVFALAVALYQSGRRIDTCQSGIVRWTARLAHNRS